MQRRRPAGIANDCTSKYFEVIGNVWDNPEPYKEASKDSQKVKIEVLEMEKEAINNSYINSEMNLQHITELYEQLKAQNAAYREAWESLNIGFIEPDIVVISPKENRYCSTIWKGATGAYKDWEYAKKAIERVKEVFDFTEPIEYHNPKDTEIFKLVDETYKLLFNDITAYEQANDVYILDEVTVEKLKETSEAIDKVIGGGQ